MSMLKALYQIQGLTSRRDRDFGQYGVVISLDGDVARKILYNKQRRNQESPLYKIMVEEVNNKYGRIEFIEDSWLLRLIQLEPMQCSCFGIEGMALDTLDKARSVKWTPHNIDSPHQAAQLVSIWLYWFNHMACLEDEGGGIIAEFPW